MFTYSGPYQESPYHELSSGTEILIGTLRFSIGESMTISEYDSVFSQSQLQHQHHDNASESVEVAEEKMDVPFHHHHPQQSQDKKSGCKFDD